MTAPHFALLLPETSAASSLGPHNVLHFTLQAVAATLLLRFFVLFLLNLHLPICPAHTFHVCFQSTLLMRNALSPPGRAGEVA